MSNQASFSLRGRNLDVLTSSRTSPHLCPTASDTLVLQMAQPA